MTRFLLTCTGAAFLLLSGCMVGPKYVKPTAPLAPSFKETTDWKEGDGWKVAKPEDTSVRGKWWKLYGDPKLNELERQLNAANPDLHAPSYSSHAKTRLHRLNNPACSGVRSRVDLSTRNNSASR